MDRALLNHIDQLRHDALLCAFLGSGTKSVDEEPEDRDEKKLAFRGAVGYVTTLSYMRMAIYNQFEEALLRKERHEECRHHKIMLGEPDCHPVLEPDA